MILLDNNEIMQFQKQTSESTLVSVIIPVYNVEKYLSKCLDSVLAQTHTELQIILVDDGSPDRCGDMCDAYAERDSRIEVIHKENGGLASARNAGLRLSKGEWIAWVDSDDWVEPDMVEYLLNGALSSKTDISVCGRYEVYRKNKYRKGTDKGVILTPEEALRMLLDVNCREIENFMWDKLWRRSLFDGIIFPEGRTFEDFAVTFQLFERAKSLSCLPGAKYYYLQRTGSIMQNQSITNKINRYNAARVRYDGMIEKWPQFEDMLIDRCIRMAVDVWKTYFNASRADRRNAKGELKEISLFLSPFVKNGYNVEQYGKGGNLTVKLLPYPYWWSFALARIISSLYTIKHGAIKKRLVFTYRKIKQLWTATCNASKHFVKNAYARRNSAYIKKYRKAPIKDKSILYDTFWGRGAMCNPFALFEYLLHDPRYADFEHIWALDNPADYSNLVERYSSCKNVKFVHYMEKDYLAALCESKYLFNNTAFPAFFVKRKGQVYINTWHGIPLKKIGPDAPNGRVDSGNAIRNFLQTDYIVSANPFLSKIYMETYCMDGIYPGRIVEIGYPRLDTLVNKRRAEYEDRVLRMGVALDRQRKTILYAPTWRESKMGKKHVDATLKQYQIVKDAIECALPDYQVLVKVHQYVYRQIKDFNCPSYIIPATVDANEVLPIADILLADYSSIFFDYLYFDRPILFFIPDIDSYVDERGLYMPINSLPGPASKNLDDVIGWLKNIDEVSNQYRQKLLEAKEWCCNYDVGNISKHLADIIFSDRKSGHSIVDTKNEKKKLLLQIGGLANITTEYTILSLLNQIDFDRWDVTLAMQIPSNWKQKEFIESLDRRIRVIVQNRYVNVTYLDDIKRRLVEAYGFSGWRKKLIPLHIYREEMRKRYSDCKFDLAVHLGTHNFADLMVVALLRGEDPQSVDFNLEEQNRQAYETLLSNL